MSELVSVIVPVLNGSSTLPGLLGSLERQDYRGEWEVIVADNGSVDRSPDVATRWRDRLPGLRIVDASGRRGASHARNVGAREARGWFAAFTDHDDEADPAWLRALVEGAGAAAIVAGRCDFERLNDRVRRSWYGNRTMDRPPRALGFLPFASGSNLGIHAEALRSLGGWDESLYQGHDIDLSWRAQLAGFPIAFAPGAIVYRRHRATLAAFARQQFSYGIASAGLHRRYRAHLQPSPLVSLRALGYTALTALDLLGPAERRGRWVGVAARRLGMLAGTIREGVLSA